VKLIGAGRTRMQSLWEGKEKPPFLGPREWEDVAKHRKSRSWWLLWLPKKKPGRKGNTVPSERFVREKKAPSDSLWEINRICFPGLGNTFL